MFEVNVDNIDFVEETFQAGTKTETNCINLGINDINFGLYYEGEVIESSIGS